MASLLEQFRISDFLDWYSEKRLILNPDFQRRSVWTPDARTFLIDTILRQLPIPKIYMRTTIDVLTKKSIREVVDGQQRLRAIIDFSDDKFRLGKRANEFVGLQFSTLNQEQKEVFLSYAIAVDQLLNATDEDVLEVFARLNSYSVSLNDAEKRHARYQGDFKWAVYETSKNWKILWEKLGILSVRQRVRMLDDQLTAEMYGVLLNGVTDGGQPKLNSLYNSYNENFPNEPMITNAINEILIYFTDKFGDALMGTPVLNSPHFLMLFAALAHAIKGIPSGDIKPQDMPIRGDGVLSDIRIAQSNLLKLAAIIESEEPNPGFEEFWKASRSSTQRIASRSIRFPVFYQALLPIDI
ncbi:MAG: DUF262 domain-containing protein [Bellilinea sp.]